MKRILAAALTIAAVSTLSGQEAAVVTAIGDIHGDVNTFRSLLFKTGLTAENGHWAGGQRHLVQTGDFLDRGAGSREVMDLLQRLESEAKTAGGQVTVLLGNHEVMNLTGDLVSTTREEFAAYQDLESPVERAEQKHRILALLRNGSPLLRSSYLREFSKVLHERSFDRFFPPGFFGHRKAIRPNGVYGRWLLGHAFVHREAGALFLHGGLSGTMGFTAVETMNTRIRQGVDQLVAAVSELEQLGVFDEALGFRELLWFMTSERRAGGPDPRLDKAFRAIDEAWDGLAFSSEGPLWYRGLATEEEGRLWRTVVDLCEWHGVERIVVGHTQPRSLRVEPRFGNRVILIDTGMNQAVYRGTPSAIRVERGKGIRVWE